MRHIGLILLTLIVILGFSLRLYKFGNPIGDWHAWRQADTSAVSRNFVQSGFDMLHPKYLDISNIQSGKDNPHGYRMVEFPIYNVLQAGGYTLVGRFTIEEWGRLVSIVFSCTSTVFIYLLLKKYLCLKAGLFGAFFMAVLPFSIYYGRAILPDTAMAATILGAIYFLSEYVTRKSITRFLFLVLAAFFTASSLLLKPFALFWIIPMVVLIFQRYKLRAFIKPELWIFAVLSLAPLFAWRLWITQYPEGIPVSDWLFNGGNIRFTGAYFYWIFAERLSKLILGYFGIFLLLLGLFKQDKDKNYLFFISFLASALLYLVVIARGNVQHDYYQILIIPTLCLFLGRGVTFVLDQINSSKQKINRTVGNLLVLVSLIFMLTFSWFYVRDYFNINNINLVIAGQEADKILPKNAKVIALNDGDTSFLYYVNRSGWPALEKDPDMLARDFGATHMVIASPTENDINGFGKKYQVVASRSAYLILKFNK